MKKLLILAMFFTIAPMANASFDLYLGMPPIDLIIEGPGSAPGYPLSIDLGADGINDFESFCVEFASYEDESFIAGEVYFGTIDEVVMFSPDPDGIVNLTERTKKLYAGFVNNSYTGDVNLLQKNIWMSLEGNPYSGNSQTQTAVIIDVNTLDTTNWENVFVLNVWDGDSSGDPSQWIDKQSQLIMVPAPGAILLAGLGTSLVGLVRRRSL